jgi:hypothetical protein
MLFLCKIAGLWIRIGIGFGFNNFVDPHPNLEFGSRAPLKKKCTVLFIKFHNISITKRSEIVQTTTILDF